MVYVVDHTTKLVQRERIDICNRFMSNALLCRNMNNANQSFNINIRTSEMVLETCRITKNTM